jgi:phytoene/squalene synthetase
MNQSLASSITKAGSKQTYYTLRFLVDRGRTEDAYRAYGYFRWVDDILDAETCPVSEREAFLERQKELLESCYRRKPLQVVDIREKMLVELVQHDQEKFSGLQLYLRNMMEVMEFDVGRRGRVISQVELEHYTYWLASAVTEFMHYFIGHNCYAPQDTTRYQAVMAAHITHMLRDTVEDVRVGYYNIPHEVLEEGAIGPKDVDSAAYQAWVQKRVRLARAYFEAGREYLTRLESQRCCLAGFAYIARFEWVLDTIEREGYRLRVNYDERKRLGSGVQMSWHALSALLGRHGSGALSQIPLHGDQG